MTKFKKQEVVNAWQFVVNCAGSAPLTREGHDNLKAAQHMIAFSLDEYFGKDKTKKVAKKGK